MDNDKTCSVVIVAGGKGLRAGGEVPKQFQLLGGTPMLMRTIEAFYKYNSNIEIVVVLPEGYDSYWNELCRSYDFTLSHKLAVGGETRFHSVRNGLQMVNQDGIVGVHDAARPFVSTDVIARCYNEAEIFQCGVIPVVEEHNSVRIMVGYESEPFDRSKIRIVQTPQVFPTSMLINAYNAPYKVQFTDDASVAEADGIQIKLVEGDKRNIKITTSFDFEMGEWLVK